MKQVLISRKKQLVLAVMLAVSVSTPSVFAAGMPGAGTLTLGGATLTGGVTGTNANSLKTFTGLVSGATITATKASVIQWGGPGAPKDTKNAGGFNVLSGNTLNFANSKSPVLNVDASGNTSVIAGQVDATGNLFIANANGITVTPGGTISAPMVGLIGANLATNSTKGTSTLGTLIAPTSGPQFNFANSGNINVAMSSGSNITVNGTINNGGVSAADAADILIAGSGSVNVNANNLNYAGKNFDVLGGTGFVVTNAGNTAANIRPVMGSSKAGISSANAYAATNVSLTNAAPTAVFANGNLTFSGYSTMPSVVSGTKPNVAWNGVLENTAGSTLFTPSNINGSGATNGVNPWYATANPKGGFLQTPVGSIVNNGLLQTVTTGLTTVSNGFTNTGTLRIGTGGGLTVTSTNGTINLGGTIQGSNSSASVSFVDLNTTTSGDINVSAPLTITGSGAAVAPATAVGAGDAGTFYATAKNGNVSISGVSTVTSTKSNDGATLYQMTGNNISITANQTISNSTAASNTTQPDAVLTLNGSAPGTVTVGSGSTLTAGDVNVSGASQALTNLVADGNITATNYADAPNKTTDGRFTFNGNNMSGSGAGSIAAQVFDLTVMGNARKSQADLTNNFWSNGLVLTSEGSNPTLNLYANGNVPQFINFRVSGNITANSATTAGPDFSSPKLNGTASQSSSNPNARSQLMLMSTGNLTIAGGGKESAFGGNSVIGNKPGATVGSFYFPGLSYFGTISSLTNPNSIGSGSITSTGSVNNAVAQPIGGGQGLYFMSNNVNLGGSLYTNMNSYVNFANASQIAQYANQEFAVSYSTAYTNTLNMAPPAKAIGNVYSIPAN